MKGSFEENIKRLEEIVAKLESGEAKLADSIGLFEEGVKLTKELSRDLEEAEGKIKLLTNEKTDTFEDFEVKENG